MTAMIDNNSNSTGSHSSAGYSPTIQPITFKDVASASEKIYNEGITKTNLQASSS